MLFSPIQTFRIDTPSGPLSCWLPAPFEVFKNRKNRKNLTAPQIFKTLQNAKLKPLYVFIKLFATNQYQRSFLNIFSWNGFKTTFSWKIWCALGMLFPSKTNFQDRYPVRALITKEQVLSVVSRHSFRFCFNALPVVSASHFHSHWISHRLHSCGAAKLVREPEGRPTEVTEFVNCVARARLIY